MYLEDLECHILAYVEYWLNVKFVENRPIDNRDIASFRKQTYK